MAGRGGPQPGSGRPSKAEEMKTANIARAAIQGKFGTIEEGFKFLLESGEASLIKFVFEHGFGKPQENVNISGELAWSIEFNLNGQNKLHQATNNGLPTEDFRLPLSIHSNGSGHQNGEDNKSHNLDI